MKFIYLHAQIKRAFVFSC